MATKETDLVLRRIRDLAALDDGGELTDRELLERFAARREEAAFAALVHRYGPLVLGVCRRVLRHAQDAEDAFQATFVVLARKATSIRKHDSVGGWLYRVAYHTALKARARAARRQRCERATGRQPPADRLEDVTGRDLLTVLDDELQRLPDRLRVPLISCYLRGQTRDQAARQLGWSLSTLQRRLVQGRERLRSRLTRRGLALSAGLLVTSLSENAGSAAITTGLTNSAVRAALLVGSGSAGAEGAGAASAAALAAAVLRSMAAARLAVAAVLVAAIGMAAFGAFALVQRAFATRDSQRPLQAAAITAAQPKAATNSSSRAPEDEVKDFTVSGQVLDLRDQPLAGARVVVVNILNALPDEGEPRMRILSQEKADGQGRFHVTVCPAFGERRSHLVVLAAAAGHGLDGEMLDPDAEPKKTVLHLSSERIARTRLIDLQGAPAAGVKCRIAHLTRTRPEVMSLAFDANGKLPFWPEILTTDKDGWLTVPGLGPGQSVGLDLQDERFARTSVTVETDNDDAKQKLPRLLDPAQHIEGRITYADTGKPVAGARMTVVSFSEPVRQGSFSTFSTSPLACDPTDGQGSFRLNPYPSKSFTVEVLPPEGQPYLGLSKHLVWPEGAARQQIAIALPRGVLVRGKVTEAPSGKPVAAARIIFHPHGSNAVALSQERADLELSRDLLSYDRSIVKSRADGSFAIAAPPVPGHLLVMGPSRDYVTQIIGSNELYFGKAGGRPRYYHAVQAMNLKRGDTTVTVAVTLRRGITLRGQVLQPDGQPVAMGALIAPGRVTAYMGPFPQEHETTSRTHQFKNGRFELHGCDPDKPQRLFLLSGRWEGGGLCFRGSSFPLLDARAALSQGVPRAQFGAVVDVRPGQKAGGPLIVRLAPCGVVTARFVDARGKAQQRAPVPHSFRPAWLQLVVAPGPPLADAAAKGVMAAEEMDLYGPSDERGQPLSTPDAQGRTAVRGLVPGATYRIELEETVKEFAAQAGKTVDLGDIPVDR